MNSRLRDVWPVTAVTSTEQGAAEVLAMLHRGHITLDRAAELMNTSAATVTTYLDQVSIISLCFKTVSPNGFRFFRHQMQDLFTSPDNDNENSIKQQTNESLLEPMNENKPHNILETPTIVSAPSTSPNSVPIKPTKRN
jgi:hypothetical protein